VDIGIRIKDYREELVMTLEMAGLKLAQQFGKVRTGSIDVFVDE
jgi:hypothetical protein